MKRLLLLSILVLTSIIGVYAQGEIVLGTTKSIGSNFKFYMALVDENEPVFIDWGDGVKQQAVLSGWSEIKNTEGELKKDTIIVYGNFKQLDIESCNVNVLIVKDQPNLKNISALRNELTYDGIDLSGAPNLTFLDLSHNKIRRLDVRELKKLEIFQAGNNEELSTVIFPNGSSELKSISMPNCDITHFYPISLPNLNHLDLANGNLDELEIGENYPNLYSLNVQNNSYLRELDVTQLSKLNKLIVSGTMISELNLVNNPELITLDASNTKLEAIDIANCVNITSLQLANTKIAKVDLRKLSKLQTINLEGTLVKRIDLSNSRFIRDVNMKGTAIQFLDMHAAIGTNRLNKLDIRNCVNMTPQSLNFTFMAMPPHLGSSWGKNVFIEGSNGETSNTDLLKYDSENFYEPDVRGDGTASMDSINIVMESVAGTAYTLVQVANDGYYATWNNITTKAIPGFPIKINTNAGSDMEFIGVEINGTLYEDSIFVVSADATIKPVFKTINNSEYIKLTVSSGTQQQYFLRAENEGDEITIDWGNGDRVPAAIGTTTTQVMGTTNGTEVKIYGSIVYADFASYPGVSVNNRITAIDLSHNNKLHFLSTYMNPIYTLDVSNQPNLDTLDCAYSELRRLDITNNDKLVMLLANGNLISEVDLSRHNQLKYLDLSKNELQTIDLSNNNLIEYLNLSQNILQKVEVENMLNLNVLRLSSNIITDIDLTKNTQLTELDLSLNRFKNIDVSKNTELTKLMVHNNQLKGLDLTGLDNLGYINIGDNTFDACALNDIYYSLSTYKPIEGMAAGFKLFTRGDVTYLYNDAEHAESKIATDKGWVLNYEGDGTGCNVAYVTIEPSTNGEIHLYTPDNTEVLSGSKVKKETELRVEARPAAGYELEWAMANKVRVANNKFVVREATWVEAQFQVMTFIDNAETNANGIQSLRQAICITTAQPTPCAIYTIGGQCLFQDTVDGQQTIAVPQGIYLVKANNKTQRLVVE